MGGCAAIGGLIDLAMYKSEKAKLKAKLKDWWLRFDDVKWSNFGRRACCSDSRPMVRTKLGDGVLLPRLRSLPKCGCVLLHGRQPALEWRAQRARSGQ